MRGSIITQVALGESTMHHRQGTTLIEVLAAIFIMGIGTLAIMAMFPLAAVSMARSIRDDRVAHGALNAKAIAIAKSIRFDARLIGTNDYFTNANADGLAGKDSNGNPIQFINAPINGTSWPLYVDPVGDNTYAVGDEQRWVGGPSGKFGCIRRRPLSFATTTATRLKWCTLLDDVTFDTNGQPAINIGFVTRNPAPSISYAWLLRRPKSGTPSVCDLTVVIYNQRSLGFGGIRTAAKEAVYNVTVNSPQQTVVSIQWQAGAGLPQPQITEGGWILDMTPTAITQPPPNPPLYAPGNARFYRVVSVGDISQTVIKGVTYNLMDLELATPMPLPSNVSGLSTIAIMNDVVEVIELGDSWRSWNN
jgi:hypothetical protein